MRRAAVLLGMALLAGLAVTACASSGGRPVVIPPAASTTLASTPTPSSAPSSADVGAAYLAIVAPVNAAGTDLSKKLTPGLSLSTVPRIAKPMIDALHKANNALLRLPASGQAATDIRALTQADAQFAADLESAASLTNFDATFSADTEHLRSAVEAVRADLGLPAS